MTGKDLEGVGRGLLEVLSRNLLGETGEYQEDAYSRYLVIIHRNSSGSVQVVNAVCSEGTGVGCHLSVGKCKVS
jgi:hypothetical protein